MVGAAKLAKGDGGWGKEARSLIDGGTGRTWKEELEPEDAGGGLAVSVITANEARRRVQQAKMEVYVHIGMQQHTGWVSGQSADQDKTNYKRRKSCHNALSRNSFLLPSDLPIRSS